MNIKVDTDVLKNYEVREKIPYKDVMRLLQYVQDPDSQEFSWVFLSEKPDANKADNDYSNFDTKSVNTHVTGYSFSSVRSSVVDARVIKLKSVSQMSRYASEASHKSQKRLVKIVEDPINESKKRIKLPAINKTTLEVDEIPDDEIYSVTGKIGYNHRKDRSKFYKKLSLIEKPGDIIETVSNGPRSVERQSKGKVNKLLNNSIDFPLARKTEALDGFINQMKKTPAELDIMNAAQLMKYLYDIGIDIRILNLIRSEFLKQDKNEKGELPTTDFIKIFRMVSKHDSQEMESKVINFLQEESGSVIKYSKFTKFLDYYNYVPVHIKKDRNFSQELYYILTSNKFSKFGEKYETEQEKTGVKEGLDMLWLKIEERFHKVARAFRFFDINNNGTICFNEFELGIHKLGMNFTREHAKKMFDYADTDHDGNIQYNEFCELCEEARRGIDPYKFEKANHHRAASEIKHGSEKLKDFGMTGNLNYTSMDDDIISSSLASFKKKKNTIVLPSTKNEKFTYGIKTPMSDDIGYVMNYEPLNEYLRQSKVIEDRMNSKKVVKNIFK
uniref:EF-hand domain-containing protein n=1 Tax=Euplotes harpa TaxID=151035 RepID=A0A7S3N5E6_9SPIT|mmetsp:Transcript_13242/g.15353  ORF Transcript_13242/g.15353 Transcript_13242/m.15353 type:complete len:557 (+) Transcript_13242:169-1839(+)